MKKLLTLLLVAAMAVASFGVLTACGDKSGGGSETTTSSTLEGEWYYEMEDTFAPMRAGSAGPVEQQGVADMPKLPGELTLTIAKTAESDKAGELEGMDYVAVLAIKYNLSAVSDEDKEILSHSGLDTFEYPVSDGNAYVVYGYVAFAEEESGDYSAAMAANQMIGRTLSKVVYKDKKLNVTFGAGDYAQNSDWKYRALGENPDVAGTWSDDGTAGVGEITVVTEGTGRNTLLVGKYAIVEYQLPWGYGEDYVVLFKAGTDMACWYGMMTCNVTKVTAAA